MPLPPADNTPYTRFKGPLRVGSLTTGGTLVDGAGSTGGAGGGSAANPLYAYALRPDVGTYLSGITSSAPDMRISLAGADFMTYTTQGPALVSTGAGGFGSTAGTTPVVFITQTTITAVPGTVSPVSQVGAALSSVMANP